MFQHGLTNKTDDLPISRNGISPIITGIWIWQTKIAACYNQPHWGWNGIFEQRYWLEWCNSPCVVDSLLCWWGYERDNDGIYIYILVSIEPPILYGDIWGYVTDLTRYCSGIYLYLYLKSKYIYIYISVYLSIYLSIYPNIYIYIYVYLSIYLSIYPNIYIYIFIHTYIYIYINLSNLENPRFTERTSTNLGRSHRLPHVCTIVIYGKLGDIACRKNEWFITWFQRRLCFLYHQASSLQDSELSEEVLLENVVCKSLFPHLPGEGC